MSIVVYPPLLRLCTHWEIAQGSLLERLAWEEDPEVRSMLCLDLLQARQRLRDLASAPTTLEAELGPVYALPERSRLGLGVTLDTAKHLSLGGWDTPLGVVVGPDDRVLVTQPHRRVLHLPPRSAGLTLSEAADYDTFCSDGLSSRDALEALALVSR